MATVCGAKTPLPKNKQEQVKVLGQNPKREFRGAWIQCVNNQWTGIGRERMQNTLTMQLDELKRCGINAIMFQVRAEADALYESKMEPWSRYLTAEQGRAPEPYWDPLAWMVEECHRRGMECHAWINPYRAKTKGTMALSSEHPYFKNPERFFHYDGLMLFDPGQPENRDYICSVAMDIVERYDVDGLHIDDYFYPYPTQGLKIPDNETFKKYGLNKGYELGEIDRWRRDNVNTLVKTLSDTIKSIKPNVKFGVSPFGIYRNKAQSEIGSDTKGLSCYDNLYADILLWANNGWLDYVIPQLYWELGHPAADYTTLFHWWKDAKPEQTQMFIGQDVGRSLNQVGKKINLTREAEQIGGNCFWSGDMLLENKNDYKDSLQTAYFKHHAIAPNFPKLSHSAPLKPENVRLELMGAAPKLCWDADKTPKQADKVWYYIVYATNYKANVIDQYDPTKIVYVGTENEFTIPEDMNPLHFKYVVTAVNRMQNESETSDVCRHEE